MINDQQRNQFYKNALGNITGKTVLDIGAGTGLLSVIAVTQGARKVYSFERDPQNCAIAREFIQQAGLADRIELICADILNVDYKNWPHDAIDISITSTFANDCFTDSFVFLVDHVSKNFNLSAQHRWIPESIDLNLDLVEVLPQQEFVPGVELPEPYQQQIESAVKIYRDHFYHRYESGINMPVAKISPTVVDQLTCVDNFVVDRDLRSHVEQFRYKLIFDHHGLQNPYIKIDWVLRSGQHSIRINQASSWRNIAFKVNDAAGKNFYFRFNSQTHSLIGSQF